MFICSASAGDGRGVVEPAALRHEPRRHDLDGNRLVLPPPWPTGEGRAHELSHSTRRLVPTPAATWCVWWSRRSAGREEWTNSSAHAGASSSRWARGDSSGNLCPVDEPCPGWTSCGQRDELWGGDAREVLSSWPTKTAWSLSAICCAILSLERSRGRAGADLELALLRAGAVPVAYEQLGRPLEKASRLLVSAQKSRARPGS